MKSALACLAALGLLACRASNMGMPTRSPAWQISVARFHAGRELSPDLEERAAGLLCDRIESYTGWPAHLASPPPDLPERPPSGAAPRETFRYSLLIGYLEQDGPAIVATVEVRPTGFTQPQGVLTARAYHPKALDRALSEIARSLTGAAEPPRRVGFLRLEGDEGDALVEALLREFAALPRAVGVRVSSAGRSDPPVVRLDDLGVDALLSGRLESDGDGYRWDLLLERRGADAVDRGNGSIELSSSADSIGAAARTLRDSVLVSIGLERPEREPDLAAVDAARRALARGIEAERGGALEAAIVAYSDAAARARAAFDRETEALAQNDLGLALARRDESAPESASQSPNPTAPRRARAVSELERALAAWRAIGDLRGEAATLRDLGDVLHRGRVFREAEARYVASLRLWLALDDAREAAFTHEHLGGNFEDRGDDVRAFDQYNCGIRLLDSIYDPAGAAIVRNRLAWLLATAKGEKLRDLAAARDVAQRAVADSRGADPHMLDTLALIQSLMGDDAAAVEAARRALALVSPDDSRFEGYSEKLRRYEEKLGEKKQE